MRGDEKKKERKAQNSGKGEEGSLGVISTYRVREMCARGVCVVRNEGEREERGE